MATRLFVVEDDLEKWAILKLTGGLPVIRSEGAEGEDFLCGSCETTLLEGFQRDRSVPDSGWITLPPTTVEEAETIDITPDIGMETPGTGIAIYCPNCEECNDATDVLS